MSSESWTISVGGRVYGPYSIEQMRGFHAEGRLADHSLVARAGEDHKPQFDVEVRVKGLESLMASSTSKRGAEKAAAAKMLARIDAGSAT